MSILESIRPADLNKVARIYKFPLVNRNATDRDRLIGEWLAQWLTMRFDIPTNRTTEAVFFRSLARPDYKRLFHEIINASKIGDFIVVEDFNKGGDELNSDLYQYVIDNISKLSSLDIECPETKSAAAFRLCVDAYVVEKLIQNKFEIFISFSDMQSIDYLAACYFANTDVKTVSMQHGLYVDYGNLKTINVINYENHMCDYILTWGDETGRLIKKYNPSARPVVCGKPNLSSVAAPSGKDALQRLVVVFDQEIFREQNIAMYRIAQQFASRADALVTARFHPHNNIPAYEKLFGPVTKAGEIRANDLIIGHSSSLFYELSAVGHRAIRYASDIPAPPFPKKLSFQSLEEAEAAWDGIGASPGAVRSAVGDLIKFIGSESRRKYEEFFSTLRNQSRDPRFSIIIPTKNSSNTLTRALDSISAQTFENFEVVIMDGISSDWTLQIAKDAEREDSRIRVFSGVDSGVYDAMNKAVSVARGEYLLFIGSDDRLHDASVLADIDRALGDGEHDFVYGDVNVQGKVKWAPDGGIYGGVFDINEIKKRNVCHQAIFYKRDKIIELGPYDLKFKLCADWDMNMRFFAYGTVKRVERVVTDFFAGGMSTEGGDPVFGQCFKAKKIEYFGAI